MFIVIERTFRYAYSKCLWYLAYYIFIVLKVINVIAIVLVYNYLSLLSTYSNILQLSPFVFDRRNPDSRLKGRPGPRPAKSESKK